MKIEIEKLKKQLEKIALKYVSEEEATYYASELVEAYIRKFPRSNVLKDEVVGDTERQEKYKENQIVIKKELLSLIQIDFNHLPMTFKLKWLHDKLAEKASKTGIAILGFDNSGGMHTLHTWVQGLAKRGYFAFAAYNGGPAGVVPLNGNYGLLGTNPFAYAFPTEEGEVVVDMATSEIPYFEICNAKANNKPLVENTAVDCEGKVTTKVEDALFDNGVSNLLPLGGNYKGYAINYLMEIMTGAMVFAKLSNKMDLSYINEEHGGFIIVIDIKAFSDVNIFKKSVSEFNQVIRSQSREGQKVIVPGDNNLERLVEAKKSGEVEVDESVWKELLNLAN